jgi:dGTPase
MNDRPGAHKSPEAAIMDWCDDISYALHDLEDFFRANMIPLELIGSLTGDGREAGDFLSRASHELASNPEYDPHEGAEALQRLKGYLPAAPYRGSHDDRRGLHTMSSQFIDSYFGSTTVHATPPWVRVTTQARHEVMLLKQLTWQYVVNNPALATMQEGQKAVIDETFTSLHRWIQEETNRGTAHRLPSRLVGIEKAFHEDQAAVDSLPTSDAQYARIVADYICSLTEEQVVNLYGRLSSRGVSSVFDGWVRW